MDTGGREGSALASTWTLPDPPFGLASDPSHGYGEQLGVRFDQHCTGGRHLKSVPLVSSFSCEALVEDWLALTNGTSRV